LDEERKSKDFILNETKYLAKSASPVKNHVPFRGS
jgi:hypothetical protein